VDRRRETRGFVDEKADVRSALALAVIERTIAISGVGSTYVATCPGGSSNC